MKYVTKRIDSLAILLFCHKANQFQLAENNIIDSP